MAAATSPSYESEAVALIEVRPKWRVEKDEDTRMKGKLKCFEVVLFVFEQLILELTFFISSPHTVK